MAHPRRLTWLPAALRDLQRLDQFVREHNPDAANRAVESLRHAAESLLDFPERGRPYDRALSYRDLLVPFGRRGYVMRYRVADDAVVIVGIWHSLEDRP